MEYQKITNLLGNIPDKAPRFITIKWIEVHDQSGETYNTNKQIRFKTSMLRSDLCDFSNAHIGVKGTVTVSTDERDRDEMNTQVILKNNASFISCISKINGVLVENAEDLDIVMSMYNLLEYSKNYSKTSASLWSYYRDELTDDTNDNNNPNKNVINSKSFKHKASITGSTYNVLRRINSVDGNPVNNSNYDRNKKGTKEVEMAVPLKHLGNFWNSLNILLVNCEVSLALSWSANCVITGMEKRLVRAAQGGNPVVYDDSSESAAFKITDCKCYVPVVTLSAEIDNKLLEQLKTGFKRTFKNEDDRTSFSKHYVPKVEIKDFNVLIDGKPFFEIPVKIKEAYETITEMSKNNDYTTDNLLDYEYLKDHYKLIRIDLSKKIELENHYLKQQINFIGRLEENNAKMFFIIEKEEETTFDFSQNSVVVV